MRTTEAGQRAADARRRWVALLFLAGIVGVLALAAGAESTVMRIAYLAAAVAGAGLLLGLLTGRLGTAQVLHGAMAVAVVVSTALGVAVVSDGASDVEAGGALFRAVVIVSGLTFLALGPRVGQVVSLVYVLLATVAMMALGVPLLGRSDLSPGVVETVALLLVMVAILRTLSARVESLQRSAEEASESAALAFRDELTALPNRRQLAMHLAQSIARAQAGGPVDALVLFDLDHFKEINDTMGHNVGDEVLRRTAAIASAAVREDDIVGRWGGEEFVALLHGADEAQAVRVAERCRRALASVGGVASVTASFGVTTLSVADDVNAAIGRADAALYAAKQAGRNQTITRQPPDAPPAEAPHVEAPPADDDEPQPRVGPQIRLDAHLEPEPVEGTDPPPQRAQGHDGDDGDGDASTQGEGTWRPR